jgi:hypothetical protein
MNKTDKIFENRLRQLERTPRTDSWQKIEARLGHQTKERPLWIYYSTAASLALLLAGGLWLAGNQTPDNENLAQQSVPNKVIAPVVPKDILTKEQPSVLPQEQTKQVAVKKPLVNQFLPSVSPQQNTIEKPTINIPKLEPTPENIVAKVEEKTLEKPIVEQGVVSEKSTEIAEIAIAKPKAEAVIVVNIPDETTDSITDINNEQNSKKKKKVKLFGLFRQLKNAAIGEPVDWNDVGTSPSRILARTDRNIDRTVKQ